MTTKAKYYSGEPGNNYITDPELFNAIILQIIREGKTLNFTESENGYTYSEELSGPLFVNPFFESSDGRRETVMIKFKV